MSGDASDVDVETRAVIEFFYLQGKAPKEILATLTEHWGNMHDHIPPSKTGWPSLNVVIFAPVLRLVLDDTKQ